MILGIDPGAFGALAFYDGENATVFDMLTTRASRGKSALDVDACAFTNLLTGKRVLRAFVEQVTSRPRQAGQFTFGVNYGRVLGTLEAAGIPIVHVSASKWKPAMGLRGEDKAMSVKLAEKLFPNLKSQLYGPRGAPLDGRAEALLIAYYGSKL